MAVNGTVVHSVCENEVKNRKNGYHKPKNGLASHATLPKEQIGNNAAVVKKPRKIQESFEEIPLYLALLTYLGYGLVVLLGYLHEVFSKPKVIPTERNREAYVPLYSYFESFYERHVYRRIRDCWGIPICSVPGATVVLKNLISDDNGWTLRDTGTTRKCLNLSSYNYLGFAENKGPCLERAEKSVEMYGLGVCSSRQELGTTVYHQELESLMARFLGVEDSIVCGMGFATNALNIPTLASKGCLVLSDAKNHASIILGIRLSGAYIRVFKHNNMVDLEAKLREAVVKGQPRTHRPWKKIMIFCEGVYSMEGSVVNLPGIIALKKKYKAYLYLDEAHSIGAMGPSGCGVTDYYGCDPKDVDILMGTFTKSFGSAGGYLAGSRDLINHLRTKSHASCYAVSMCAPVAYQIISSLRIIMGEDWAGEGQRRIKQLAHNGRYFRQKLKQLGFTVYGNDDSPVVPIMLYMPGKMAAFARMMKDRNVAVVSVGFPATSLVSGRARFCLSAAHTQEMLDAALEQINDVGKILWLKYSRLPGPKGPVIYGSQDEQEHSNN